jgi:hypothetical protein
MAALQEDTEQLALFHERDARAQAPRESGAAREQAGASSLVVLDPDDDAFGRALDDEPPEDAADAANADAHEVRLVGARTPANREVVSRFVS